ncbi:MAG: tRNA 2-thiouridine(34) synthase MnmA [bacterium]
MSETIAVAMSGGVDSSAAAAMLLKQGYRVIGITARMWPEGSRCCSDDDIESARCVAERLGFEHHVVDLHEVFESRVIADFVDEYANGRTPSPCALCNRFVKFGALMDQAAALGAEQLATGHYARTFKDGAGVWHLLRGVDARKDQSYFLFCLTQEQLGRAVFPLGGMDKKAVVEFARSGKLVTADRPESQDLCFADFGKHHHLVELRRPGVAVEGDIVDTGGRKLGRHGGIHRYTVGQRRGLGIAVGRPVYVVRLDAATNTVVVGTEADAESRTAVVKGVSWVSGLAPDKTLGLQAKIRYNHAPAACSLAPVGEGRVRIEFGEPQFAIAPGQVAAFYAGDELVGGGWIE